jgi:Arc/MetJ-type ribon-helix-helix transcriptional regulator
MTRRTETVTANRTSTTRRRRWTDRTIEDELRRQSAELGHFPTRSELVAAGLRGLWDAMRADGGADAWQARVDGGSSAPPHAAIAARAFELYERGAPGDQVDHWLAAERELGTGAQ